jgi:hypothetical protein
MKFIQNFIRKFMKEDKIVLGRWNIEYCNKKIDNKIDLSNEDHCGPCGQYILDKTTARILLSNSNNNNNNSKNSNKDK